MKRNHFERIFFTYMIIILVNSILVGYLSIQLFKFILINNTQINISSSLNLIKSNMQYQLQQDKQIDFDNLAKEYSKNLDSTVTIIDDNGNILGEKVKGLNKGINYANNEEITKARQKGMGYVLFYDKELQVNILNIAKYVKSDKFNGFIHISIPLNDVKGLNKIIITYVLIGVIFVLVSSFILKLLFDKDIIEPLRKIVDNSKLVSEGSIDKRIEISSDDVLGMAVEEYNYMLDKLQDKVNKLQENYHSILEGFNEISIGIVVIDNESKILLINSFALNLFGIKTKTSEIVGCRVIELIPDIKINSLFKGVMDKGEYQEFETILENKDNNIVKVSVSPIVGMNNHSKSIGCFATFYDITQLKKFEQMGCDFVSNTTHELRTPLTSIKGFIETLQNGAIEDKETAYKFLEIIDSECERLSSIINDILKLSELQNIDSEVNLSLCYMQDAIDEVLGSLENQFKKKQIKITTDIQDMPLVLINKNRIKQMLINIIDNAIKYTNIGGDIKVSARAEDKDIVISIKDSGIGIPKESLSRLFERFYRVDKGRSRNQGGTGLGLSIIKHIVDIYKGTIEIESEVGKGTEFIIRLPLLTNKK